MASDLPVAVRIHQYLRTLSAHLKERAAAMLLSEARNEIERLRLTDEERQSLEVAIRCVDSVRSWKAPQDALRYKMIEHTATLRGLLERTK
jgi:translation initiation factor 2B subunit (eIF-2B alpha/beta/delta family)